MWQDYVISSTQVVFILALFPSIMSKDKPNMFTSLITVMGLLAISICFLTLNLYSSFVTSTITGIAWSVLFIQRLNQIMRGR